ncbi:MAG: aminotransferase class I/II-fold pyridoxal phosphate-dependent enzyme [Anaerovoracaceae bacterium]
MKHKFIAKRHWNRFESPLDKVNNLSIKYDDVIDLSLGDPDLITHDIIIEETFKDVKAGYTRYAAFQGDPELRAEIRKQYKEDYNIDISDDEILITASGSNAMYLALEAMLDQGDEVIFATPCYTQYIEQIKLAGGVPIELPTCEEENFEINIDRLNAAFTERTRCLIVNSPSNPLGTCLSLENMKEIAEVVIEKDIALIADEVYTAFCYQHPFIPFLSLPGMAERTVTINSFSKDYTMTGWRIGNVVAPAELLQAIKTINANAVFSSPSVSQRAAVHAIRNRKIIQPPMVEEYKKRVFYAAERVNNIPGMSVIFPPKAAFYLFVNIKNLKYKVSDSIDDIEKVSASQIITTSKDACDFLLEKAHVLTIPGTSFGAAGEGYIRIACTVGIEKLKEAFDRIELALK